MAVLSRRKGLPRREAQLESTQTQAESQPVPEPALETRPARRRSIGQLLRETREGFGSDLNRVATALRIRAAYLEAIEEGRYDQLPGAVYALGFVRAYAAHLGLDGEEAVRRFKLEAEGFDGQHDLTFPVPLAERSIPGGTMVMVAVILAICGYGLWYYLSSSARPRPERVPAVPAELALPKAPPVSMAPPPSETSSPNLPSSPAVSLPLAPAPTEAAPPEPSAVVAIPAPESPVAPPPVPAAEPSSPVSTPAPEPPRQAAALPALPEPTAAPAPEKSHVYGVANGRTRIVLHATGDSWVQVRNKVNVAIFTRQLHAGDSYHVPDQPGLTLHTGLATALAVTVDGRSVPPLRGGARTNILLDPERLLAGTATVLQVLAAPPAASAAPPPAASVVPSAPAPDATPPPVIDERPDEEPQ
jgi:cytoskeleton protein RodZ